MTNETEPTKKLKTSVYLSPEDEALLDDLFIKRMRSRRKTDRSALICEGIRLLHEQELGGVPYEARG